MRNWWASLFLHSEWKQEFLGREKMNSPPFARLPQALGREFYK